MKAQPDGKTTASPLPRYRPGFDPWGLLWFGLLLLPTLLWLAWPAPCDVLRAPSRTPGLDAAASVFQALTAAALIALVRREPVPCTLKNGWIAGALLCTVGYFACWGLYYGGQADSAVLLGLCVLPCLSLLLYETGRRLWPAAVPTGLFALLHLLHGLSML